LYRHTDAQGNFIESEDEYIKRVVKNSKEYNMVQEVSKWVDNTRETQLFFKDVGDDYSDTALEFEFRKHKEIYGIKYGGYDTLKGFGVDDWQTVKQTATKLKELMKEMGVFLYAVFQLTDDAVFTDVFDLSSNNIANCKQIKHVVDHLTLGKRLSVDDYHKYKFIPIGCWGESALENLNPNKTYYGVKPDKNRGGNKNGIMLFEVDLDYNTWDNVGALVKSNFTISDTKKKKAKG
jgi:hypothetical protein